MLCCSSQKKKQNPKATQELFESGNPQNGAGFQHQEVAPEIDDRPKKKNSMVYQVQDENASASICPSFILSLDLSVQFYQQIIMHSCQAY